MRKAELAVLENKISGIESTSLEGAISKLEQMIDERLLTRRMYHWYPGLSAYERRCNEDRRRIAIEAALGSYTINYRRYYDESCRHVYTSDTLTIDGYKCSIADLRKIAAICKGILDRREPIQANDTNEPVA